MGANGIAGVAATPAFPTPKLNVNKGVRLLVTPLPNALFNA